jgi:hypothetical protein
MRGKAGLFSRFQPFDPKSLSGLTAWWDASDTATLYDATTGGSLVAADGGVARLEDKSGNSRHFTQSATAERPTRKTSIKNGLDVLRMDGSLTSMVNNATYSQVMLSTASTMFIVACASSIATNNANPYQNVSVLASMLTSGHGFAAFRSNGTILSFGYDSDWRTASVSYTAGDWVALTTRHGSSTLGVRSNGGTEATVALGPRTFFSSALCIGVNSDLKYFNGDIGEVIVYNVALSDANRNAVESYLLTKWGI